ncbi:Zinc finger RNA-binding protein, partial [Paragonimus heterotremus]
FVIEVFPVLSSRENSNSVVFRPSTKGTAGPIKPKSDVPVNGAASSAPSSNVAAASATTIPQSSVPTTTSSDTSSQKTDSAQPVVDDRKAVGAEFIEVITGSGGKGAHYRCNLCECQFTNADAKELHLKGRRHRVQYKKKVDSTLVIEPKSASVFHRKIARNERPSDRGSLFPPSLPGGPSWTAPIGANGQMPLPGQPFGRFDFRNQAPTTLLQSPPVQFSDMTIENRYMGVKHSQIIPTELEAKAMKTAVSICEHALKDISDNLVNSVMETPDDCFENTKSDSESDQDAGCSPREKSADKSCLPSEEDRFLRGVVRVGSLGKCLLLRGDHEAHLALVCAEWPTTEAVNFVHEKLTQRLMSLDHRFAYDVSSIPPKGLITVRVSREEDADADTPNEEDTSPETMEAVGTQQWPTITVHIQVTSGAVGEAELVEGETSAEWFNHVASGAVKADGERPNEALNAALHTAPEQPSATTTKSSRSRGRPMFAHGERVDKTSCLDALDAIDQAKWFQCALTKSPLGLVARVLVDFMRANELWLKLDQFAVLAYLDRLLTLDLQVACSPGPMRPPQPSFVPLALPHPRMSPVPPSGLQAQQPFCPLMHGRMHPSWIPPTIGPARLLRRFFEAIASGLLLQLKPESKTNDCSNTGGGKAEKSHTFFAFALLSSVPLAVREEVTVSAQFCLRQIAFRQLYKVLRMEPLSSQASRKSVSKEQLSTVEHTTPVGDNAGAVKRRRLDDGLNADDDVDVAAQTEEVNKAEDQSDKLSHVVNGTHNEDLPKDDEPKARTSSEKEVHVAEPTPVVHNRFNAKRGRRGR